jgi:hypothetical protein
MNQDTLSNFIEQQFPAIYREEGEFLVEFVKQYYVWLETDPTSPVFQARHYLSDHDVDTTVDKFIVYFKEKYLKNIQLNTATNTKQLTKNSIDLYRSKGTENSIKLFFDLIFSSPSEVYYPGEDVFKLSDADWTIPSYIEVTAEPINRLMVGRQIRGVYSGATAFVEKLVRRKVKKSYIEVFYISAIAGQFKTGEIISLSGESVEDLTQYPSMIGSLTSLTVTDGGDGFAVGDVVSLDSRTGAQGKALVQSLETITGIVNFRLDDGGWGYTSNAHIYLSEKVLQLANVQLQTTTNATLYERLTTIVQPMANVQWYANTTAFAIGDTVFNYAANGAVRGVSRILSAEYGNTNTSNYYLMSTISGNSSPYTAAPYTYYKAGNTASFMIYNAGWVDVSASGTTTGMSNTFTLSCLGKSTSFTKDEFVYQISSNNQIFARAKVMDVGNVTSNTFTLKLNNIEGLFLTNQPLKGESADGNVAIASASFDIGLRDVTHNFTNIFGNLVKDTSNNSLFSGTVQLVPFGDGASVGFDTDLLNPEAVMINPNYVRDHLDETDQRNWINSASYGASLNNANKNAPILGEALRFEAKTIGTIARLEFANPGRGYSYAPFAVPIDPLIAPLHKMDHLIRLKNPTGVYALGELVTQAAQGAKGLVKFANTSEVHIRRLTYETRWALGNTTPYIIKGETSGFQSLPIEITEDVEGVAGKNAVVNTKVTSSNSAVLTLKVSDSGFNYRDNEELQFTSLDLLRSGTAISTVQTQGKASGYYKTTSGFLSSNKYLYDGEYYQDFSYEIKSPITVNRYSEMLKNILHVTGTKSFSSILKASTANSQTTTASAFGVSMFGMDALIFDEGKNTMYLPGFLN